MIDEILRCALSFLIHSNARLYGVDPRIIAAIICKESVNGSSSLLDALTAYRFEPAFYGSLIKDKPLTGIIPKPLIDERSERYARAASWGLMQIMLATARENGFSAQFGPALCLPWVNISIGTRYFARLLKAEGGDVMRALRRWNGSLSDDRTLTYANETYAIISDGSYKAVLL